MISQSDLMGCQAQAITHLIKQLFAPKQCHPINSEHKPMCSLCSGASLVHYTKPYAIQINTLHTFHSVSFYITLQGCSVQFQQTDQ